MQDLEKLGLQKIANDVHDLLEPLSKYFYMNYGIEIKSIILSRLDDQLPLEIAQPQGYVEFKEEV